MHWLFGGNRLKELGILGMNRRNAACILDHNPRRLYPLVDNKLRLHELCDPIGVPTPKLYGVVGYHSMLNRVPELLGQQADLVIKPSCGSAGRGIMVLAGKSDAEYVRHNGQRIRMDEVRQHLSDILSGRYSLGGRPDQAILQQRVRLHPAFKDVSWQGIPDVRVILYRHKPAMAMLRLPTKESNGRANLHQGGIATGIDLAAGVTHHAVQRNRFIDRHPDTGRSIMGMRVPYWGEILNLAEKVAGAVGLGYLGIDVVIDVESGPLLLEANARPGLAIQLANRRGLIPRLKAIDAAVEAGRLSRNEAVANKSGTFRQSA